MARKVFISVLGFSNYGECRYSKDDFLSQPVRFVQEAVIKYHFSAEEWTGNDKIIILMTAGAKMSNWEDNGHKDRNTGLPVECEGLRTRLAKCALPCGVQAIENIPDGNNEKEIWEIFNRVYEALENGDEIYFDITHGFRFLPMLVLTLAFYSKFLKNTSLVSVTYGNYETRDRVTNIAPIIDLVSLPAILDWSFAAGQFVESGSVKRMVELSNAELLPILKNPETRDSSAIQLKNYVNTFGEMLDEFTLCRGNDIISSKNINKLLMSSSANINSFISPLNPIFEKIIATLSNFDTRYNPLNSIHAARWCFNKGFYQQAATILQEGIVSCMAHRHGISLNDENMRGSVNSAFALLATKQTCNPVDEKQRKIAELMADELINNEKAVNNFASLTKVRNDYNHSGMRSRNEPLKPAKLKSGIEKSLSFFEEHLCNTPDIFNYTLVEDNNAVDTPALFINFSNHPSVEWSEAQKNAAVEYGEIVDLQFPVIDETATDEDIKKLADEYLLKVREITSPKNATIHIMGEQTFLHSMLHRLQKAGYKCMASTTKRMVKFDEENRKITTFNFERFREYESFA